MAVTISELIAVNDAELFRRFRRLWQERATFEFVYLSAGGGWEVGEGEKDLFYKYVMLPHGRTEMEVSLMKKYFKLNLALL